MSDIDNYFDECFLPLTATKNRLVCLMFHDDLSQTELEQMVKTFIGAMRGVGFYTEAIAFGFASTDTTLEIYIKEPVFDVFNHLHSC